MRRTENQPVKGKIMLNLLKKLLEKIAAYDKKTETAEKVVLPEKCIQLTLPLE